jgi:hypothetical protein
MFPILVCRSYVSSSATSKRSIMAALLPHAVAGRTELALFYGDFNCSLLSLLIACLVHSGTYPALAKHLHRGYEPITRTYPDRPHSTLLY